MPSIIDILTKNVQMINIISMEKPYTQADHIASLIKTANKLGVKTYVASSNESLWDNPRYDEFFK